MTSIVPNILSLVQHLETLRLDHERYRLERCPFCGKSGLWFHGHYDRKADRQSTEKESLNPIPILRLYCPSCHKTCSVLPECIPPRRWHIWTTQQAVVMSIIAGDSLSAINRCLKPSRSTCRRWWQRFSDQFLEHREALCVSVTLLGRSVMVKELWELCLKYISLDRAMLLCHLQGVFIP